MQTDELLQRDVLEELRLEHAVDASQIGVIAKDGVVTLTGTVKSLAQKLAAEQAAKRVYGVRGIAEELEVRLDGEGRRDDAELAKTVLNALLWDSRVPDKKIKVTVDKAWVTLEGSVDWQYQHDAAIRAVRYLTGIRGMTDSISVKPLTKVSPVEVRRQILDAFRRSAELEARRIGVDTTDGKIVLHGNVHNWTELQEAQRAAWSIPGVAEVDNRLEVVP